MNTVRQRFRERVVEQCSFFWVIIKWKSVFVWWTDGSRLGAVVIVCDRFKCVLFDESGRRFPEGTSKQLECV